MTRESTDRVNSNQDSSQPSALWKALSAGSVIFLFAAVFFQPYALPAAFRPDITGWVWTFSKYPWPATFVSATSFQFAQVHIWGGQILIAIVLIVAVKALKGKI